MIVDEIDSDIGMYIAKRLPLDATLRLFPLLIADFGRARNEILRAAIVFAPIAIDSRRTVARRRLVVVAIGRIRRAATFHHVKVQIVAAVIQYALFVCDFL